VLASERVLNSYRCVITLRPGSVAFVASNEEHGWRNVVTSRTRYFVIALGRENADRK